MKCSSWLAIIILALAGCASPEHFDTAKVDKNGSFYIDCSPAVLTDSFQELCDSVVKTAATGNALAPAESQQIIADALRTKLLLRYSGINEIKRFKASSTPRKDGSFTNCAALLIDTDKKNGISVFGENTGLSNYIAELPADCFGADVLALDLTKLWESLKNSKLDLKNSLAAYINTLSGTTPEKFAARHSGVVTMAVFPPQRDPNHCLIIPDRGKHLYNRLKSFAGKDVPAEFEIPFDNTRKLYIAGKNDRLVICSSAEVRSKILTPGKKLADIPEFSTSPAQTAEPCVRLGWAAKGKSLTLYMGAGKGFSAPLKTTEYGALTRTNYGFYLHAISSSDLNVDLFRDSILDFFNIAGLITSFTEPPVEKTENGKNAPKQQTTADSPECFSRLTKLGDGLKAYAKQNNGEFPASLHTDGLNQLTEVKALSPELFVCPDSGCNTPKPGVQLVNDNTGYVYFGSWKKGCSGKLPLIIDLPDSHNQYFHVLLLDGSVQKVGLEMQMSIKRMASTLHTVFKYSEEEFQELIRRAEILDKKLDKEYQ